MNQQTVRAVALDILLKIENKEGFSHQLLNQAFQKRADPGVDRALLTRLVYGTIQHQNTLDFYINAFVKKKPQPWVNVLLRLALYQTAYLERIPWRAVIHESVEVAKQRGNKGVAGFVNGVLRAVQRKGWPDSGELSDPLDRQAIAMSHPRWLLQRWQARFGSDTVQALCEANNTLPRVTARVNEYKTNKSDVLTLLREEGIEAGSGDLVPEAIRIGQGTLQHSRCFHDGLVTIQDESSMLVAHALEARPGMAVLDACAAPGGKTTHIAEGMGSCGYVAALDVHQHKMKLITGQAKRLGLENIHPEVLDSRDAGSRFSNVLFDRILVDAPCTGLGVIRHKPEIKWRKTEDDIAVLAEVQADILDAAGRLLKPGGRMVYSTCTIESTENENVVAAFLHNHPNFFVVPCRQDRFKKAEARTEGIGMQLLPQDFGTDGFYLAIIQRKETG